MLPVVVTSVALMLVLAASSAVTPLKASLTTLTKPHAEASVSVVTKAVEDYFLDNLALPISIESLVADVRYLAVSSYAPPLLDESGQPAGNYQVYVKTWAAPATNAQSTSFPLFKSTLIIAPLGGSASLAKLTYISDASEFPDGCSNGPEFSAEHPAGCQDWSRSVGAVVSEQSLYPQVATLVSQRQEATAMLLSKRFQDVVKQSTTTTADALRGTIGAAATPLKGFATPYASGDFSGGAVGTKYSECTGTFKLFDSAPSAALALPIACNDLYNYYGKPVTYKKLSLDSFELVSDSAFKRSDGTFRKVVTTVTHTLSTPAASPRTVSISTIES